MERERVQLPEQSTSPESGESSKDSSKKKKAVETAPLLIKLTAEAKPGEGKQEMSGSLWERMANMVVPKPEEKKAEAAKEQPAVEAVEADGSSEGEPLAGLTEDEKRQLVLDSTDARGKAIAAEQSELATGTAEEYATAAAEAFVDNVHDRLSQEPTDEALPVDDAIEQAYQETLEDFAPDAAQAEAGAGTGIEQADETNVDVDDNTAAFQATAGAGAAGAGGQPPRGFGYTGFDMPPGAGGARPLWERYAVLPRDAEEDDRPSRNAIGGVLVGGIVGYLIGRRSGRIKAERRLKPAQEKLEREVKSLYTSLAQKETRIRQLVLAEKRPAPIESRPTTVQTEHSVERPATTPAFQVAEKRPGAAPAMRPEVVDVNALPLAEVLEMGEKITVGATNLREIHATNLISERGLRRVVQEFLRGGEFLPVLSAEIASKERDHELDPRMRDRPPEAAAGAAQPSQPLAHGGQIADGSSVGNALSGANTTKPHPRDQYLGQTPPAIVVANRVALVILGVLVFVLIVIWLTR